MADSDKRPAGPLADQEAGEAAAGAGRRERLFSRKGLMVFVGIVALETVAFGFVFLVSRTTDDPVAQATGVPGNGGADEQDAAAIEVDLARIHEVEPWILELGELTVYPKSTQTNAPYRITAEVKIVISKKLGDTLFKDGAKETALVKVIKLNSRQVVSQMLEEYALRILDTSVKEAFQHEAKTRLNSVQVEGDREMLRVLRLLRGHVRQVVVDRLEQSSF